MSGIALYTADPAKTKDSYGLVIPKQGQPGFSRD